MFGFSWLSLIGLALLVVAVVVLFFAWIALRGDDDWPTHLCYGVAIVAIIAGGICLGVNHDKLPQEVGHFIARFR